MKTNIRTYFLLLSIMILTSVTSQILFAQGKAQTPEERAKKLTEKMKEKLSLTKDQKKKVYELNLKYAKEFTSVAKSTDTKGAKTAKALELFDAKEVELKSILEDHQKVIYDSIRKDLKIETRAFIKSHRRQ